MSGLPTSSKDNTTVRLDDPTRTEIETQWERLKVIFETWFRTPEGQFKAAFHTFTSTDDFDAQAEAVRGETYRASHQPALAA